MQTRYQYLLGIILAISDILLVNIVFFLTNFFVRILKGPVSADIMMHYVITCNFLWLFSANLFGMYREKSIERVEVIYRSTWKSIFLHASLFVFYIAFAKDGDYSRQFLLYFYILLSFGFLLSRFIGTVLETILIRNFKIRKQVAILGVNGTSRKLAAYFKNNSNNFLFSGFLKDTSSIFVNEEGDILPSACEQLREAATSGVKEVYVTMTPKRMMEAPNLIMEAERQCIRLKFVPDLTGSLPSPFTVNYMGEFPVINLRHEPLEDMQNRFKKRLLDIVISLVAIFFILSWMIPLLALIIRLQSRGPIFFKQLRSGRDNEPFMCLKFRSMYINGDSDSRQATKNDERITPLGRFLRRSSLDELPQFFNVLRGSMSVVGPRPHPIKLNEEYSNVISSYMLRHFLKPGITGWAQVNGFRGETKDRQMMESRVEHDIWYLENYSLMLDIKIIFLTIINIFKGEDNAY